MGNDGSTGAGAGSRITLKRIHLRVEGPTADETASGLARIRGFP